MRADQTLADLHYTIQIAMDWTASYLNEFLFRGKRYSVSEPGVAAVREASYVILDDLCLRPNECIQYRYNMYVPWRVQIRYEKAVPYQPEYVYPYCVSGKHPNTSNNIQVQMNTKPNAIATVQIRLLWHDSNQCFGSSSRSNCARGFW